MNIREDSHFQDFILSRDIRESSAKTYEKSIRKYSTFLKKTPTEFIDEAEKEEDEAIRMKNRKIKKYLLNYKIYLQDQGLRYTTIKSHLTIIRSFYTEYGIELPRVLLKEPQKSIMTTTSDLPGRDEIRLAVETSNHKYASIILLMASSGMGRAEVQHLKIKDFTNALNYEDDINKINILLDGQDDKLLGCWKIQRFKTGMPYITFSSPESSAYIIRYLQTREDIREDDPLFTGKGRNPTSSSTFESMFKKINREAGFGKTGYHHYFLSHKLRKFFASTLTRCRVPQIYTDWMLGHKINRVTDAYFKADVSALKTEYLRVLPELTILEDVVVRRVTDETLREMQGVIQDQQEQIERMDRELAAMSDFQKALQKEKK